MIGLTVTLVEAINSVCPNCQWVLNGDEYSGLVWMDEKPKPTEEQLFSEIARLQAVYASEEYKRARAKEYPSIEDQLDMLYHQGYDGWKSEITKIKARNPKP